MIDWKELWDALKEHLLGDEETRETLIEIKKDIIKDFIEFITNNNPNIDNIWERLEKYLINDGSIEDIFQDIFRWCQLSLDMPESIDSINEVKWIVSSVHEIPTSEKLSNFKSEVLEISRQIKEKNKIQTDSPTEIDTQEQTNYSNITPIYTHQTTSHNHTENSTEIAEQQNKFIESVYKRAAQQIWKPYSRWWTSPNTWFDCSWLRYRAFKEEWIKFSGRLNAHAFSDADIDLRKDEVKPWDFMFWDQKPWWKKKHNPIYHIEMIISKPYTRNWKTYVRTIWSSTDAKDDRRNYVGKWVQIREREMKDYRHYWRPTYYYQLAQYEKTWSSDTLRASANKPSKDLENQVLSA